MIVYFLSYYLPMVNCLACGIHGFFLIRFLTTPISERKALGACISFTILTFLLSFTVLVEMLKPLAQGGMFL